MNFKGPRRGWVCTSYRSGRVGLSDDCEVCGGLIGDAYTLEHPLWFQAVDVGYDCAVHMVGEPERMKWRPTDEPEDDLVAWEEVDEAAGLEEQYMEAVKAMGRLLTVRYAKEDAATAAVAAAAWAEVEAIQKEWSRRRGGDGVKVDES